MSSNTAFLTFYRQKKNEFKEQLGKEMKEQVDLKRELAEIEDDKMTLE
jgi:hypothetical protein